MLQKVYSYFFNKANQIRENLVKKESEGPWKIKIYQAFLLFILEIATDLFKFLILIFSSPYKSFQLFTSQRTLPVCEYSYFDHKRFQKKIRLFSAAGISSIIAATIIINLVLSLIIPGQLPSYAKTINGAWDDWSLNYVTGDPAQGYDGVTNPVGDPIGTLKVEGVDISSSNLARKVGVGNDSYLELTSQSYYATDTDSSALVTSGSATGGRFIIGANDTNVAVSGGVNLVLGTEPLQGNYQKAAAGTSHSCVINNGSVYCWGYGAYGQLGNGGTSTYSVPVRVIAGEATANDKVNVNGVDYISNIKEITAGGNHTCAISNSGNAYCWGYRYYGQIGNGTYGTSSSNNKVLFPVRVVKGAATSDNDGTYLINLDKISAGQNSTCVVTTTNNAYCWGYDGDGQLGQAATTTRRTSPVQVKGVGGTGFLTGVAQISAGYVHTCAVKTDGTAYCWGSNGNGNLGDNTTTQRTSPVQILKGVASGDTTYFGDGPVKAVQISASGPDESYNTAHTCAIKTDGTAYCWGYNINGQLGNGTTTNSSTPVSVSGISGVIAIDAAGYHSISFNRYYSVALLSDGTIKAWGNNALGQLGDGTTTQRITPVSVTGISNAVAIDGGYGHALAILADGTLKTWGSGATSPNSVADPYKSSGTYESETIDLGGNAGFNNLSFTSSFSDSAANANLGALVRLGTFGINGSSPEVMRLSDGRYRLYYYDWYSLPTRIVYSDTTDTNPPAANNIEATVYDLGVGSYDQPEVIQLSDGKYRIYYSVYSNWNVYFYYRETNDTNPPSASNLGSQQAVFSQSQNGNFWVNSTFGIIRLTDGKYRIYYKTIPDTSTGRISYRETTDTNPPSSTNLGSEQIVMTGTTSMTSSDVFQLPSGRYRIYYYDNAYFSYRDTTDTNPPAASNLSSVIQLMAGTGFDTSVYLLPDNKYRIYYCIDNEGCGLYYNETTDTLLPGKYPIRFQIATNSDNATWSFVGSDGTANTSFYYTGTPIPSSLGGKRYVRYKTYFSTTAPHLTPTLSDVTVNYTQYPSNGPKVTNLKFNSGISAVKWSKIEWVTNAAMTSSVKVKAKVRAATSNSGLTGNFVGYDGTNTGAGIYFDFGQSNCSLENSPSGNTKFGGAADGKYTYTCTINQDNTIINSANNQWLELEMTLVSDGSGTVQIDAARATYSVNSNPEVCAQLDASDPTNQTCDAAVTSTTVSQSLSDANYGHIVFNTYIRDQDTADGNAVQ